MKNLISSKNFSPKPTRPAAFCSLVDTISSQIECVSTQKPSECDEVAVELFEPMKMESQHSLEDLACLIPEEPQSIGPTTSASIDQQPIEHEVEVEKPRDLAQEVKPVLEPIKPSNAPISDLSDSLSTFGNVEQLCAENKSDIWTMVRNRICSRKIDLAPHSKCFLDTSAREKKCSGKVFQTNFQQNAIVFCLVNATNSVCCYRRF